MSFITALIALSIAVFVFPLFIMLLWNGCLVPAVAIVTTIGYWQALGLSVMCGLIPSVLKLASSSIQIDEE